MKQKFFLFLLSGLLAGGLYGCAGKDAGGRSALESTADSLFSAGPALLFSDYAPSAGLPAELKRWSMPSCPATEYQLVQQDNRTVLHARAVKSASSLRKEIAVEPAQYPVLAWSWKVDALLPEADNTQGSKEDAPVRIILTFEGDKNRLSFREQLRSHMLKLVSGEELPYATLMYIWENRQPVDTVINSTHTSRIKMIVAASGTRDVGQWMELSRNIREDYRRVFGEEPGRLMSIGVMTDSNKTAGQVEAYYGDIRLVPQVSVAAR